MGGLRVGIGASEVTGSGTAGRNAATDALRELGDGTPALVMVYASVRFDLPELLAAIREVFPGVPLVGATSSGQFHRGSLTPPGNANASADKYRAVVPPKRATVGGKAVQCVQGVAPYPS